MNFSTSGNPPLNSKLIIHVIDASSSNLLNNIQSVDKILTEIGAFKIPCIRVFNKIDLLENGKIDCIINNEENDIYISALKNQGIDKLKEKISDFFIMAN